MFDPANPGNNAMGQSTPLKHGTRPPEARQVLAWAEIAGLVDIRADGSWQMTDFAKEWLNNHPPAPVRRNVNQAAGADKKAPSGRGPSVQ